MREVREAWRDWRSRRAMTSLFWLRSERVMDWGVFSRRKPVSDWPSLVVTLKAVYSSRMARLGSTMAGRMKSRLSRS